MCVLYEAGVKGPAQTWVITPLSPHTASHRQPGHNDIITTRINLLPSQSSLHLQHLQLEQA